MNYTTLKEKTKQDNKSSPWSLDSTWVIFPVLIHLFTLHCPAYDLLHGLTQRISLLSWDGPFSSPAWSLSSMIHSTQDICSSHGTETECARGVKHDLVYQMTRYQWLDLLMARVAHHQSCCSACFHPSARILFRICLFINILKRSHESENGRPWPSVGITWSPRYLVGTQVPFHWFDWYNNG